MEPNVCVLILAAGEGSRMNQIKQLLPVGKTSLLGNAIQTAFQLRVEKVFCVLGAHKDEIIQKVDFSNIDIIENSNWDQGLSTSIVCGINHIKKLNKYSAVLILLADQPDLKVQDLDEFVTIHTQHPKTIIATDYGKFNGVPALFPEHHFETLLNIKGDKGAKDLLNSNKFETIQLTMENNLRDIDTPEDYLNYKKLT